MKKIYNYLKLMRVKHYIKNFLIFIPLIFSGQILNSEKICITLYGFLSFSLTTSIVYIINDIKDIEKDKKHPIKKNRPLASGIISKNKAVILIVFLLLCIVFTDFLIIKNYQINIIFVLLQIIYLLINIFYSIGLKKIPIVDVVILVSGFVIRVLYGGVLTNIEISNWLYLTIMSGSFYMGLGKRRNELIKQSDKSRDVLKKYNKDFLDKFMYVFLVLSIVFYSLWCIDIKTISKYGNNLIWTIPIILIILMKYSLDVESDSFGDPVDVLLHDKILIVLSVILLIVMMGVLYL